MASPWKNGIEQDDSRSDDDSGSGQQHRAEAHRAGVHHGLFERHAFLQAKLHENQPG